MSTAATATTATKIQTILDWYQALPMTPDRAREGDHTSVKYLLDRSFSFDEIVGALFLGASRRLNRHPDLPPLEPIKSFAYFIPVAREVYAKNGLDAARMVALHYEVFGVYPQRAEPGQPPRPPQQQQQGGR